MTSRYNQPSLPIQVWGSESKIWELPEGWGVLNLGQLVEMKTGFACAKKNLVSRGVPHLRPFNIGTNGELDFTEVYQIPDDFVRNVTDYALETGHILFNNTNSVELVGKTAIVREPVYCAYSNHITRLTILNDNQVLPEWLALALRHLWATGFFAANCNKWIGQAGINTGMLADVDIPVPHPDEPERSLAEQHRIITRIETLLEEVREARKINQAIAEDTDRLMDAVLREVFEEGVTLGWPLKTVDDLILGKPQYGTSKKASEDPTGVPVIRMGNIVNGEIVLDDLKYLELPSEEEHRYLLNKGDILFNRTNSAELVGKSAVYRSERSAVFASYLIRIVLDPEKAHPSFVVAYINSSLGREYIQSQLTRAIGQVNVNAKKLQAMSIPTPSLIEQNRVTVYLDTILDEIKAMKTIQEQDAQKLHQVEQAILAQAFRGEL